MKTIAAHIVRVTVLLTLYVCCSSVVCCEASTTTAVEPSEKRIEINTGFNKHSLDEDLTPLRLISIRLTELL